MWGWNALIGLLDLAKIFSSSSREYHGMLWPDEIYIPSSELWVYSSWICQRKAPMIISPNYFNWLLLTQRSSNSLPFNFQTPQNIPKTECSHSTEETHLNHLYLGSYYFRDYPKLTVISEDWNVNQLVNQELCLLVQLPFHHNSLKQCPHYC